jgi:ketosteroid isomerase-like protein
MIPGAAQAVVETILAREKAAMERWRHGDPMGWAEISADEVTYIDPGLTQPIHGLAAYRKYLDTFVGKVRYDGSEFVDPRVAVYGDVAVLAYNYVSTAQGATGEVVRRTPWNSTEVYALVGGDWKIIHTHWSHICAQPPDMWEILPPVPPVTPECGGVLAELLSLEQAAVERWCRGDPCGIAELSAEEVTCFDASTPRRIDGLEALRVEYQKWAGQVRCDIVKCVGPSVQVRGHAAVLTYRYVCAVLHPNGSVASWTPWNCTEVFVRREGTWKIVHTHRSYVLSKRS